MVHVGALEQQTEKAYQKQSGVSQASKAGKKGRLARRVRDCGLGFTAPAAAVEGTYIDKKCPWAGDVSIRGRILKGMIVSTKMKRTVMVRRHYLHYIPKYKRYEKRHKNFSAHISPAFDAKEGDIVTCGECRPLSKTVCFNVLKVETNQIFGAPKKQFRLF